MISSEFFSPCLEMLETDRRNSLSDKNNYLNQVALSLKDKNTHTKYPWLTLTVPWGNGVTDITFLNGSLQDCRPQGKGK